jgi:hypothetical protein
LPQKKKVKVTTHDLKHDALRDRYFKLAEWVKHHQQKITRISTGVGAVIVITVGYFVFASYNQANAERAYADAYEIFSAEVTQTPSAQPARRTYPNEEQKYRDALEAFTRLANDYGTYREIAGFYAAVCKVHLKQPEGKTDLERLANGKSSTAKMALVALADQSLAAGDYAGAEKQFRQALETPGELPEAAIRLGLAQSLEFQGKKQEAVEMYLKLATDYRSKDEGREAIDRLTLLDPASLEKVPPEKPNEA